MSFFLRHACGADMQKDHTMELSVGSFPAGCAPCTRCPRPSGCPDQRLRPAWAEVNHQGRLDLGGAQTQGGGEGGGSAPPPPRIFLVREGGAGAERGIWDPFPFLSRSRESLLPPPIRRLWLSPSLSSASPPYPLEVRISNDFKMLSISP